MHVVRAQYASIAPFPLTTNQVNMDNYIMNQRKRCGFSLAERIVYAVRDFLFPGKSREAWRKHALEMQNELNQNNWDRHGFYMTGHNLCCDWTIFTNHGWFIREQGW